MAQRHPTTTRRPDRPAPDEKHDDELLARAYEASSWARRNTQVLVIAGIVLVVAVMGVLYWISWQGRRSEQAVVDLERIQQIVAVGDPASATAELTRYVDAFSGTPYAEEARLILAELHLRQDRPQDAVAVLEASGLDVRDPLGVQITTLEGKAHEAAGQLEQAGEAFLAVAERAELQFQRTEALADAARVRSLQGRHDEAAGLYDQIVESLEAGNPDRDFFAMRAAEERAAAN